MNCAQYEKYLSSYIDNELADIIPAAVIDAWTDEFELHLRTCASCQQEYRQLLKVKQQLHALPDVPLAPALERQVTAFLHTTPIQATASSLWERLELEQRWLGLKVFVKRFFTPPRLVIAGSLLALVFLWLGFFYPATPSTSASGQVAQELDLEELMEKHMESVYETTNPVHQSGAIILYNRKIQNREMGQAVNYEK